MGITAAADPSCYPFILLACGSTFFCLPGKNTNYLALNTMVMRMKTGLIFIFFLLLSGQVASASEKKYEVKKLAEGVYGFIWTDALQDPIEGNALFIINADDVVVVDAGLFPSSTRMMIRELKKLTANPVRYVINTHFHDDHNNGNFVYRENWPAVAFIAHENTRRDIIDKVINSRDKDIQGFRDAITMYERWLKNGKDDSGKTIDEARKKRIQDAIALYETCITEYKSVKNAPPDITFSDSLVLYSGNRKIVVSWLGLGNTRGDAVIFLPQEKIAATGDLFVYPVPFAFGSYYNEWRTTLTRLDSLPATVLFPGHGPPQYNRDYIRQVKALLDALVTEVNNAVAAGKTLEETLELVKLQEWKTKFAQNDPKKERAFDQFFLAPAVERAWHQAKGDPDTE